jgi:PAS domain-containing protein
LRSCAPLKGSALGDLILDSADKVNRYFELCRRTRDLSPGSLTFRDGTRDGIACRIEGALFESAPDGGMLILRVFTKGKATRAFQVLNERIEVLNREVMQRKRAEAILHAQQKWLRATLLSIGDAVISTDLRGNVTLLNTVAELLTGWTQEEAAGKPLDEIFVISNENTGAKVENPVTRVLREGKTIGLANHTRLPDLVDLDLNLPKNGGIQVRPFVKIRGVECYLPKPTDLDAFIQIGTLLKEVLVRNTRPI